MATMTTVGQEFKDYLTRVFPKGQSIASVQYRETKRAFFAAYGQCLVTMRDSISQIESEEHAIKACQALLDEVEHFWTTEAKEFPVD